MNEEGMTLEEIKELNKRIIWISDKFAKGNKPNIIDDAKEIFKDINKFATWFLAEKDIGLPAEDKAYMNSEVVQMLKDIMEAMERKDSVLMFDALECGIGEYLRMFIPEEDFEDE